MYEDWNWTIGKVVSTFGRIGEIKVRLESDFPDRFSQLKEVCLRPAKGDPVIAKLQRSRLHKGHVLLKLAGVDSIDAAEAWREALVQVRRTDAVKLDEGSYYVTDIIGFDVVTKAGRTLGKLDRVLPYPAQDLYQVGDILIPAVKQFVLEVNVSERRILVDPPEGLLPSEEPANAD